MLQIKMTNNVIVMNDLNPKHEGSSFNTRLTLCDDITTESTPEPLSDSRSCINTGHAVKVRAKPAAGPREVSLTTAPEPSAAFS